VRENERELERVGWPIKSVIAEFFIALRRRWPGSYLLTNTD
jgi:hypothetical protein